MASPSSTQLIRSRNFWSLSKSFMSFLPFSSHESVGSWRNFCAINYNFFVFVYLKFWETENQKKAVKIIATFLTLLLSHLDLIQRFLEGEKSFAYLENKSQVNFVSDLTRLVQSCSRKVCKMIPGSFTRS